MKDTSSYPESELRTLHNETKVGLDVTLIADGLLDQGQSALVSLVVLPRLLNEGDVGGVKISEWPGIIHSAFADPSDGARDLRVTVDGHKVPARRIGLPHKMPGHEVLNEAWTHALRLDDLAEMREMARFARDSGGVARGTKVQSPLAILGYDSCSLARQLGRLHGALAALQAARLLALDNPGVRGVEFLPFLNKHSSVSLQSASAAALFNNGTEQISLADPGQLDEKAAGVYGLVQLELKQRIAWAGRMRPRAADQMGFNAILQPYGSEAQGKHKPEDVAINKLLAETVKVLVSTGIDRQSEFDAVFSSENLKREIPKPETVAKVIGAFSEELEPGQLSEHDEAYLRVLLGLSETLVSRSDRSLHALGSGQIHPIDLARGAYEIALVPELSQFERARSPSKNGRSDEPTGNDTLPFSLRFDRRVSGILAYPEVARMFGLIVDLKVSVEDIKKAAASLSELQMDGGPQVDVKPVLRRRSAVKLDNQSGPKFGPVSIFDSREHSVLVNGLDPLFANGVVQMAKTHRLMTLDVNQAYESAVKAAGSDQTALSHGEPLDRVTGGMTGLRTAGLVLVDTAREQRVKLDLILSNLDEAFAERPQYLEDLVTGYRVDVGKVEESGNITWAQGSQRRLSFPGLTKLLGVDLGVAASETSARDRNSGSVQSPHRLISTESDPRRQLAVPFQTICTWRNWTFGAPSVKQDVDVQEDDLQIDLRYSVDRTGPKMMRQRIGRAYVMGARSVMLNGSSLSFEEAVGLYRQNAASQGAEHEESARAPDVSGSPKGAARILQRPFGNLQGYPIYRHDPIGAPKLFLDAKHAPAKQKSENAPKHEVHLDQIVAATQSSDHLKWRTVPRYLLVDASSFDQCLLDGVLDRFKKALPGDSYVFVDISEELKITDLGPIENIAACNARALSRDHLVRRYWADPKAEVMFIGFFKDGEPAPREFYPAPLAINLYPEGRRWPDAVAVQVEVRPVDTAGPIFGSRQRAGFRVRQSSGIVRVVIELEPAEIAEVRAWCLPRELSDLAELGGYEAMIRAAVELSGDSTQPGVLRRAAAEKSANVGVAALSNSLDFLRKGGLLYENDKAAMDSGLFETVTLHDGTGMLAFRPSYQAPLHGISHSLKFEATHAVTKPLKKPKLKSLSMTHELNETDVRTERTGKVSAASKSRNEQSMDDPYLERWRTYLLEGKPPLGKTDPRQRQTSQRVLLAGAVSFDRRSTSELKLRARWRDYGPKTPVVRDHNTQTCKPQPVEKVYDMAELGGLAYELGVGGEDLLDLAITEGGQPRLLTLNLDSTRATRLQVSATAASRFSRHYDTEIESDLLTLAGDEIEIWLPSTRRPDEPRLNAIESAIHFSAEGSATPQMREMTVLSSVRRAVRLRIDLGEQWYSSGEAEKLGIVCYPSKIGNRGDLGETTYLGTEDTGFLGFSVWGRDPIFETGELDRYVTTDQFINAADTVIARLPIALGCEGQCVTRYANCDLALFDVTCDPDTGRYYVDIEVDPEESYNAFIRLQIVRHQTCALKGLETSFAAAVTASLLPVRELRILQTARGFELTYSGVTYRAMSGSRTVAAEALPDTAHLDVFVLRLANGSPNRSSGLPVESPGHGTIQEASALSLAPDMSGDIGIWRIEVTEDSPLKLSSVHSIPVAPGNLDNGVLVFLRESETYLTDPSIKRDATGSEPVSLQTVSRAVASISVALRRTSQPKMKEALGDVTGAGEKGLPSPAVRGATRIQVGVFEVRANANRAASTLNSEGMLAEVHQVQMRGKHLWSVIATGDGNRATLLSKVHRLGFKDAYLLK